MRDTPFSAMEISEFEELLCALLYPLRNAIYYLKAIRSATVDSLTQIGNRKAFDQTMALEVELARRHRHTLSLLAIDIDRFKHVNDTHGHHAGDTILQQLVASLQFSIRSCDQLFRYGGKSLFSCCAIPIPKEPKLSPIAFVKKWPMKNFSTKTILFLSPSVSVWQDLNPTKTRKHGSSARTKPCTLPKLLAATGWSVGKKRLETKKNHIILNPFSIALH